MTDPLQPHLDAIDAEYPRFLASGDPMHNESAMRGEGWNDRALSRMLADIQGIRIMSKADTIASLASEVQLWKLQWADSANLASAKARECSELEDENAQLGKACAELAERCNAMENDRAWAGVVCFFVAVIAAAAWWGGR